jgi:DNA polymerase-1
MTKILVMDFETKGIQARPKYPPAPVGVALGTLGRAGSIPDARYYAWGHPTANNCKAAPLRALRDLWDDPEVVFLFHNGKFDIDVAMTHWGFPMLPAHRWHDTLYLLYLDDPRRRSLALKPSAETVLGMKPEERDAVREWLIKNGECKARDKDWPALIWRAPGDLVGHYAMGDIKRTAKLFHKLMPSIKKRGMLPAYTRELMLMPMLLENESEGIRVDLPRLRRDCHDYLDAVMRCDRWLHRKLGGKFNVDADDELANRLYEHGVVKEFQLTATGARSVARGSMVFENPAVGEVLEYRGQLAFALRTFMVPWLTQAEMTGGRIHTNWNQVRGENDKGTRTGRISSNPNFQNLSNEYRAYKLPLRGMLPLPNVRSYLLPDEGDVMVSLDYSQQELRALAHFEDGPLHDAYIADPSMDVHEYAQKLIHKLIGRMFARKPVKTMGFGLIYGMGIALLASSIGEDEATARVLKDAYLQAFPGLKFLQRDLKSRAALNQPIRTWGGREYYCEDPRLVRDRRTGLQITRTFEYKLLNILVQGSSADCTKEAMVRWYYDRGRVGRFLMQVHDQIVISVPKNLVREGVKSLRRAMESVEFDIPMLTDASCGLSFGQLKAVKS